MNLFDLFATLSLDSSGYTEGLADAETQGQSFGNSITTGLATAARVGAVAVAATTTAVIGASTAFVNGVTDVAMYGDEIDKTSQRLGLSTTAFQEWDYVLNIAGTSMQSMQIGMKTLTNQIDEAKNGSEDAQEKFAQLGISLEDLNTMSREEIFEQAIYGFQGMADSTERAALANDLFGRSGQELTPLFNMTAEETQGLIEQANEYGMVMSEDAVAASAAFKDSLTTLQGTLTGVKNNLLSEFLPSFSTVMDGLSAIFAGDDSGLEVVRQGVSDFADKMNEVMPMFLEIGGEIVGVLGDALVQNLPTIISTGATVMNKLVQGLIQNLPALISAATLLITEVTKGLIQAAPDLLSAAIEIVAYLGEYLSEEAPNLIDSAVDVIIQLVEMLTDPDNVETLLSASLQIILAIAQGLIENAPELIGAVIVAISNLVVALMESLPLIADAVMDFVKGLGEDLGNWLYDMFGDGIIKIGDKFSEILTKIGSFGADVLEKAGEIGADVIEGVVTFFSDIWDDFESGLDDIITSVITFGTDIVDDFFNTFEDVKDTVSGAIDALIGFFDFDWELPDIKLPHFTLQGEFSLENMTVPTIGIEWYAKAMSNPMLLTSPTLFGMSGGKVLGGGEAGAEMIYGRDALMRDIKEAVNQQIVIPVYIGSEQIDEIVVNSNQRYDFISGGRG